MTPTTSCHPQDDSVPGCHTGPAGRVSFVVREALLAWRRRGASATTRTPVDDQSPLTPGGTP